MSANGFGKSERLCGKTTIAALFKDGSWGVEGCFKFCFARRGDGSGEEEPSRIMISVPKRFFKRAVRRNLLKRRIREAYRTRKNLLQGRFDILFQYNTSRIADFDEVSRCVENILKRIK